MDDIEIDICYTGVAQLVRAAVLYTVSVVGSNPTIRTEKFAS